MRHYAGLFLIAISVALAESITIRSLVFPAETSTSYVEMVPLRPMNLAAFTLCMRAATELTGEREIILFAYRTEEGPDNTMAVWREKDGRYSLYLSGDSISFKISDLGATETNLCVTWDSSSGATAFYTDGKKSLTKFFKKGHTVPAGGRVIIGQDPDNYLGGFEADQSFVGEISDINMWDSVLSERTLLDISYGQRVQRGNVLDWGSADLKVNDQVEVIAHEL